MLKSPLTWANKNFKLVIHETHMAVALKTNHLLSGLAPYHTISISPMYFSHSATYCRVTLLTLSFTFIVTIVLWMCLHFNYIICFNFIFYNYSSTSSRKIGTLACGYYNSRAIIYFFIYSHKLNRLLRHQIFHIMEPLVGILVYIKSKLK